MAKLVSSSMRTMLKINDTFSFDIITINEFFGTRNYYGIKHYKIQLAVSWWESIGGG